MESCFDGPLFYQGYNNTHQALCAAKIEKSHRNIGVLACENSPTNSLREPFCFKRQGKLCGRKTPALVELRPLRGGCKKGRKRCAKHTNKQTNKEREKVTLLDSKDTSSMPSKLRVTLYSVSSTENTMQ